VGTLLSVGVVTELNMNNPFFGFVCNDHTVFITHAELLSLGCKWESGSLLAMVLTEHGYLVNELVF